MTREPEIGELEWYLRPPRANRWNPDPHIPAPHEAVAWRKFRKGRWIAWSGYSRWYSWNNIRKWVWKRGDVYQIATASGQIVTVKPSGALLTALQAQEAKT